MIVVGATFPVAPDAKIRIEALPGSATNAVPAAFTYTPAGCVKPAFAPARFTTGVALPVAPAAYAVTLGMEKFGDQMRPVLSS